MLPLKLNLDLIFPLAGIIEGAQGRPGDPGPPGELLVNELNNFKMFHLKYAYFTIVE